ncbi:MAG: DUF502 domain-containing protein [Acidobacteriota bacterium]
MKKLSNFIKTTLLGGLLIILPIVLTFFFVRWIFNFVFGLIEPMTRIIVVHADTRNIIGHSAAIIIIITVCFVIGLIVKTRLGKFLFGQFEKYILKIAPGYSIFRETLKQLFGQEKKPFSSVVLGKVFGNDTLMTGFIADEMKDGRYTIYFPSALNPTTGLLCHLKKEDVIKVDIPVETAMRTIISCGAGASELFQNVKSDKTP